MNGTLQHFIQNVENECFAGGKVFFHCFPSGTVTVYMFHRNVALNVEGVIPVLDVAAHSLQVPVRGGDGDGQFSPRDQGGAAQPDRAARRHFLSSQSERVKYQKSFYF